MAIASAITSSRGSSGCCHLDVGKLNNKQIHKPSFYEALMIYTHTHWSPEVPRGMGSKVEVCAGEGNLSRSLQRCGYSVKAFDATWIYNLTFTWHAVVCCSYHGHFIFVCTHKVRYSGNHNILRTVGFLAILGAVEALDKEYATRPTIEE